MGFDNFTQLATAENTFLRAITSLPQSTPTLPLRNDLGRKALADLARLRPILYCRKIWCTPELATYAEGLRDIIDTDHHHKISWLRDMRSLLTRMCLTYLWDTPSSSMFPPRDSLKVIYWKLIT